MSLLSIKDHDLVIKAINFYLENRKSSDDPSDKVEMATLRQWVTLRKGRLSEEG
jgi:hypothetical protein